MDLDVLEAAERLIATDPERTLDQALEIIKGDPDKLIDRGTAAGLYLDYMTVAYACLTAEMIRLEAENNRELPVTWEWALAQSKDGTRFFGNGIEVMWCMATETLEVWKIDDERDPEKGMGMLLLRCKTRGQLLDLLSALGIPLPAKGGE